jgi:hypothetical protein
MTALLVIGSIRLLSGSVLTAANILHEIPKCHELAIAENLVEIGTELLPQHGGK